MIDLSKEELSIVSSILKAHDPGLEVWAFGSRVNGTARRHSDLDLIIISSKKIPLGSIALLKDSFSESNLPFRVDVLDWSCTGKEMRRLIKAKHHVVRRKKAPKKQKGR